MRIGADDEFAFLLIKVWRERLFIKIRAAQVLSEIGGDRGFAEAGKALKHRLLIAVRQRGSGDFFTGERQVIAAFLRIGKRNRQVLRDLCPKPPRCDDQHRIFAGMLFDGLKLRALFLADVVRFVEEQLRGGGFLLLKIIFKQRIF